MRALILAGGSGTRFWPASRRQRPKQLVTLEGSRSLLQTTVDRLAPLVSPRDVFVCTTTALLEAVRQQLPEIPPAQVLAEPEGRNTAAAIAWGIAAMPEGGDDLVTVLPADHRLGRPDELRAALSRAAEAARREGRILTLGVRPSRPDVGYGYLEVGEPVAGLAGLARVDRFTEKPDLATALRFMDSGRYLWNAGIFVFARPLFERLVAEHLPELAAGLTAIRRQPERLAELYAALPSVSIDVGLMEKLDDLLVLPLDGEWSDLGSWEALAEVLPGDALGNVRHGEVVAIDARDNLLWAEDGLIAVLGVEGLVVVRAGDAVLVAPRHRSQEVRAVVEELAARRRDDLL